jgi:hypothetical protein
MKLVLRSVSGYACFIAFSACLQLSAQTVDDGVMVERGLLFGGYVFKHDAWDQYWEGTLKRSNGNIGTLTTQTTTIYADYGLINSVNVIASIPYVWTNSSQGVLAAQSGWQDITFAVKYRAISKKLGGLGRVSAFAVPFWGTPLTNYTPDFQPVSLGLGSRRLGIRSNLDLQTSYGLFVTGTAAYTWRGPVYLDRPYYFTNSQFFQTNKVPMPDVVEYSINPGFRDRYNRMAQFTFSKLITRGGPDSGDIRRQDLPFVSNRIISTRIGTVAMVPVPFVHGLSFRFEYSYVVDGRNVGQSSTFTTGLFRTQPLFKKKTKTP